MDPIVQNVIIGFNENHTLTTVNAKQGDTEREIKFTLVDDLVNYVVQDTTYIFWKQTFPNGYILPPLMIDKSGLSEDGTTLLVKLTRSMLSVYGLSKCEICFVKSEGTPTWDDAGHLTSNAQLLTTQTFNLYVSENVYSTGCLSPKDAIAADELVDLVIAAQAAVDEAHEAIDDTHDAIAAVDTAIAEGQEAINNAIADAQTAVDDAIQRGETEIDAAIEDVQAAIEELQGMVDEVDNVKALNIGGTYIDDEGISHEIVNEYTDVQGDTHVVEPEDFDGMSFMAVAGYARDMAEAANQDIEEIDQSVERAESAASSASYSAYVAKTEADRVVTEIGSLNTKLVITVNDNGELLWEVR